MLSNLEFTTSAVLITLVGLIVLTVALIFIFKSKFGFRGDLTDKYREGVAGSFTKTRAKYNEVDAFSLSRPFLYYGLAASLLMVVAAMSWTTYEDPIFIPDDALELDEEIEIEPPRTAEPPPPPPPPPPPVIEEVPEEEIEEDEEIEFEDQSVEDETVIEDLPEPVEEEAPPPPPPPPPPPEEEEIFKRVEQMPRFPGCEDLAGGEAEKKKCAEEKMIQYLYKNLKYPAIARENGVEGTVVIQFVVDKKGNVDEVKLVKDIGAGCGEAAQKVVESMNNMPQKWTPGKQRGRAVSVYYTLPVRFRLQG